MTNPFIEKAERENPFETKARRKQERTERRRKIAARNRDELAKLFRRFTDNDDPSTRERMRARVVEAQEAVDKVA